MKPAYATAIAAVVIFLLLGLYSAHLVREYKMREKTCEAVAGPSGYTLQNCKPHLP